MIIAKSVNISREILFLKKSFNLCRRLNDLSAEDVGVGVVIEIAYSTFKFEKWVQFFLQGRLMSIDPSSSFLDVLLPG